jgi:hypothetical protein
MMRNDFCAFILTHGRADRVYTYETLKRAGYTGKVYIVIDNEDQTADQYRAKFGDQVLMFDKAAIAKTFDEGDNFNDRRAIIYARNACFELAKQVGCRYFIQLDDDYDRFDYRFTDQGFYCQRWIKSLDVIFSLMVDFLSATCFYSVAMGQSGDYIAGKNTNIVASIGTKRKAMNSFVCDTEKQFSFVGRINEDVNTYTAKQRQGFLFISFMGFSLKQQLTQTSSGGMTDLYLDEGTYIKTFYSVMYAPSCVKVSSMHGDKTGGYKTRIHHLINWNATAPKIIREEHRKARTVA